MTHSQVIAHTRLASTVGSGGASVFLCIGTDGKKRSIALIAVELVRLTFVTPQIILVVYTYWRLWQIKHEKIKSPALPTE